MDKIRKTPSQTVGPFFAFGLTAVQYGYDFSSVGSESLAGDETPGERISIKGRVFDGNGDVIPDAMIELWQPDGSGKYRPIPIEKSNNAFIGFGRLGTGTTPDHSFVFQTIMPGATGRSAPHINVILFMRGSLRHLYTRIYFPGLNNESDPVFSMVEQSRRNTLVASKSQVNGRIEYQFDIHMQGEKETVFFDI
jgi:protocatechuate 3,4-dioxygenase alpha subunit